MLNLLKSNSFKLTIIFVSSFHLTFWLLLELSFLISSPRHFVYLCHWCIKNSFCQKIMKTIFTLSKGHNMLCKCVQLCNYANLMETWWSMNLLYRQFIFFRLKMAQKSSKRHRGNFEVVTAQPLSLLSLVPFFTKPNQLHCLHYFTHDLNLASLINGRFVIN